MLKIQEQLDSYLALEASGILTKEEFLKVIPVIEEVIEKQGHVNILLSLNHFEGSKPAAVIEELRFDVRHRKQIERTAILTEKPRQRLLSRIAGPILSGEVRCFYKWELDEARDWLHWPAKHA